MALWLRGQVMGEAIDMPLMSEYLFCKDMGWTWADFQSTPKYVLDLWMFYRSVIVQIQNEESRRRS